jgi:hypothetical protein
MSWWIALSSFAFVAIAAFIVVGMSLVLVSIFSPLGNEGEVDEK